MTVEGVRWATRRLEEFASVHDHESVDEGLEVLKESVGFTEPIHDHVNEWAKDQEIDNKAFCLGVLTAFMASEYTD